jgi:hypothetical protein
MTPSNRPAGKPVAVFAEPPAQTALSPRRRLLTGLLAVQLFFLFLVFPLLFVYFENKEPEAAGELSQRPPAYSLIDGLYWSLITPVAPGPHPAWPQTAAGKTLVRISDTAKLLAIATGVGLLYETILTRRRQAPARRRYLRRD